MFTIFRRCELTLLIIWAMGGKMGEGPAFVNKGDLLIGKIAMAVYLNWLISSILTLFSSFVVCLQAVSWWNFFLFIDELQWWEETGQVTFTTFSCRNTKESSLLHLCLFRRLLHFVVCSVIYWYTDNTNFKHVTHLII